MSRWMRVTAGFTAVLMLWTTLLGTGISYAEEMKDEDEGQTIRTIVGRDTNGWAVVDIKSLSGHVVELSPLVGRAIDLDEGIEYSMFQGPSEFNRLSQIPILATSIPGFQKAIFLKRPNGKYGIRIEYTVGTDTCFRAMSLKETDLKRIREYVENFDKVQSGEYKIHKRDTKIEDGAEYPKLTEEEVTFETRVPRFVLASRLDGSLVLKDGKEIKGELLPVYDEGSILIEADFTSHTVEVDEIERIRTSGNKSSSAMKGAIRTGVGSAISGALTGALAAWQSNADVSEWVIFGSIFFGTAGFLTGLARGIGGGRSSEDIVLGPLGTSMDDK